MSYRSVFVLGFGFALLASTAACSALTEPQEITIAAEPVPSPNAPAPGGAQAAQPGMPPGVPGAAAPPGGAPAKGG